MQSQPLSPAPLKIQSDRPLLPADQSSERYLLITFQTPELARSTPRSPLNLSLVIDRSGSMSGDKLNYVKEAARHVLRLLTEADRLSTVIYDDEVEILAPNQILTPQIRADLLKRISEIRTGGMTNLSGGWFTGCDQIANYLSKDYLNRALLLTDGLANQGVTDQEQLVHHAKELRRRGISTTTFGVGKDFNQFLLQGIADGGGGHFYFIDKPNQIPNYFAGELGELLTTAAREMTLELKTPAGVEITLLNNFPVDQGAGAFRIFLGDAYGGELYTLVLKLKFPALSLGRQLALSFSLRYEDVQQRQAVTLEETVTFTVTDPATCAAQPANEAVLQEASRQEAEKAKMEALEREYKGEIVEARGILLQASQTLKQNMPAPMAAPLLDELDKIKDQIEQQKLTGEARKEIHYMTYQVRKSRQDYKK
jgi:Ca-activated chloride channel family protein